jgi:type II secretory pathway component PulC
VLKLLILLCTHQASCFILRHVEHTLSSHVVPVNDEVNVVKLVFEEGQSPVEVRFDICGTNLEPEIPVDQDKPRMHLTLPCVFTKFTSLMLLLCCIR